MDLALDEPITLAFTKPTQHPALVDVTTDEGAECFTRFYGPTSMCVIAYITRHEGETITCTDLGPVLGVQPSVMKKTLRRLVQLRGATLHDSFEGKVLLVTRERAPK